MLNLQAASLRTPHKSDLRRHSDTFSAAGRRLVVTHLHEAIADVVVQGHLAIAGIHHLCR